MGDYFNDLVGYVAKRQETAEKAYKGLIYNPTYMPDDECYAEEVEEIHKRYDKSTNELLEELKQHTAEIHNIIQNLIYRTETQGYGCEENMLDTLDDKEEKQLRDMVMILSFTIPEIGYLLKSKKYKKETTVTLRVAANAYLNARCMDVDDLIKLMK